MPRNNKRGLTLLFVHQNFSSQYWNCARHYAANQNNRLAAVGDMANLRARPPVPGVALFGYETPPDNPACHPLSRAFEKSVLRGRAALEIFLNLRDHGFRPDLILLHPAWGEGMFVRQAWPDVPVLAYAESWPGPADPDFDFDAEFPRPAGGRSAAQVMNAAQAATLAEADHLQAPFYFQLNQLPESLRAKCSLLHDGIDSDLYRPDPHSTLTLPRSEETNAVLLREGDLPLPAPACRRERPLALTRRDKVITFVSRSLEPYRGWHSFARALPRIQRAHPDAHCVIVGRATESYGPPPPPGQNWRDIFLEEIAGKVDFSRLHILGNVSRQAVITLLGLSRAHVCLTYPFTLSYSPLEAMSCAAPIVACGSAPMLEVFAHGENALLADFFSPEAIADAVDELLGNQALATRLGAAARDFIIRRYDLKRVWRPRWHKIISALAAGERPQGARWGE